MLQPLSSGDLALVRELQERLGVGDEVTMQEWRALEEYQRHLAEVLGIASEPSSAREQFCLMRDRDDAEPLVGPRWWFHLLGLRHGSVHVMLTTPQNWVVVQRRSWDKDDSPGALDVAVSGHMGLMRPEEAAWREMAEEIGLREVKAGMKPDIVGNNITFVDRYDVIIQRNATRNPPFIDAERRWVYTATLTPEGLARMHFADGEVTWLAFIGPEELQRLNTRCVAKSYVSEHEIDLASGLVETLPRWFAAR